MREIADMMKSEFARLVSKKLAHEAKAFDLKYDYVAHRYSNATATSHDIIHGFGHRICATTSDFVNDHFRLCS